jgi:hypothetical protein
LLELLALALAQILLRTAQKSIEEISSQYRIVHGRINAENMNLRLISMPNDSRTGVAVKNGCNGVIKSLL